MSQERTSETNPSHGCLSLRDFDVSALRPNLGSLLDIPPERQDVVSDGQVRHLHQVHNTKIEDLLAMPVSLDQIERLAPITTIKGTTTPKPWNGWLKLWLVTTCAECATQRSRAGWNRVFGPWRICRVCPVGSPVSDECRAIATGLQTRSASSIFYPRMIAHKIQMMLLEAFFCRFRTCWTKPVCVPTAMVCQSDSPCDFLCRSSGPFNNRFVKLWKLTAIKTHFITRSRNSSILRVKFQRPTRQTTRTVHRCKSWRKPWIVLDSALRQEIIIVCAEPWIQRWLHPTITIVIFPVSLAPFTTNLASLVVPTLCGSVPCTRDRPQHRTMATHDGRQRSGHHTLRGHS